MIGRNDRVKARYTSLFDSRKEILAKENVVNTFGASIIGRAMVVAVEVGDGIR